MEPDPYTVIIDQFLDREFPLPNTSAAVRFESVAAEVFGTKQRRYGPMPPPERQVAVRDVLRQSNETIQFFVPWASRKAKDGVGLDLLEFMALKQLDSLRVGLNRLDKEAVFHFRVEDLTDLVLFGETVESVKQIYEYGTNLEKLICKMLPSQVVRESDCVRSTAFVVEATRLAKVFSDFLHETDGQSSQAEVANSAKQLEAIGWKGVIPQEQRDYYYRAFRTLYPDKNPASLLSRYFACTLTRIKLGATAVPAIPHIQISFAAPVPGNPINNARVYYRTLPERHTHNHVPPWNAIGYLLIDDQTSECSPKFMDRTGPPGLVTPCTRNVGGASIETPYVLT